MHRPLFSSPRLAAAKRSDRTERAAGCLRIVPLGALALVLLGTLEWWRAPVRLRTGRE
jgi:hypothetical protein